MVGGMDGGGREGPRLGMNCADRSQGMFSPAGPGQGSCSWFPTETVAVSTMAFNRQHDAGSEDHLYEDFG